MPKKKLNRERIRKPAPRHQKEALLGKDWRQELRENPDRVELKADDSSVGSEESYDAADEETETESENEEPLFTKKCQPKNPPPKNKPGPKKKPVTNKERRSNPTRAAAAKAHAKDPTELETPFDERENIIALYDPKSNSKLPLNWREVYANIIKTRPSFNYSSNEDSQKRQVKRFLENQSNKGLREMPPIMNGRFQELLESVLHYSGKVGALKWLTSELSGVSHRIYIVGKGARVGNRAKPGRALSHVAKNGTMTLSLGNNKLHFETKTDLEIEIFVNGEPWFEVKKSTIKGAGHGLFALRDFGPNELMALYCGESMLTKEKNTRWGNNVSIEDDNGVTFTPKEGEIYMGIHFANTASCNSKETKAANARTNMKVLDNLGCYSTRAIKKGDEIFWDYNWKNGISPDDLNNMSGSEDEDALTPSYEVPPNGADHGSDVDEYLPESDKEPSSDEESKKRKRRKVCPLVPNQPVKRSKRVVENEKKKKMNAKEARAKEEARKTREEEVKRNAEKMARLKKRRQEKEAAEKMARLEKRRQAKEAAAKIAKNKTLPLAKNQQKEWEAIVRDRLAQKAARANELDEQEGTGQMTNTETTVETVPGKQMDI